MDNRQRVSNFEFLELLVDISDPATGEISATRLAARLHLTSDRMLEQWSCRGGSWALFADEILSVLDAIQDQTYDLPATVEWYLQQPLRSFKNKTPQQIVTSGSAHRLVAAIKARQVKVLLPS